MIYVDAAIWPFRGMMMCHLMADTVEELHAFAGRLGLRREWFQDKSKVPHYDLAQTKRALAVRYGAKEVSREETVEIMDRWRGRKSVATPARPPEQPDLFT